MSNVIQDLWYGNILPQNDCRVQSAKTKELSELITKNRNALLLSLNEEQAKLLDNLDACVTSYVVVSEEEIFSYGFKLGMKMAAQAFGENLDNGK